MKDLLRRFSVFVGVLLVGCAPASRDFLKHQTELKDLFDKLSAEDDLEIMDPVGLYELWYPSCDAAGIITDNTYLLDFFAHTEGEDGVEFAVGFPGENRKPGERSIPDGYYGEKAGLNVVRCIAIPIINNEKPQAAFSAISDVVVRVEKEGYAVRFHCQKKGEDQIRTMGFSCDRTKKGFMASMSMQNYAFPASTLVSAELSQYNSDCDLLQITLDSREEGKIGALWTLKLMLDHRVQHTADELTGTYRYWPATRPYGHLWSANSESCGIQFFSPYLELNAGRVWVTFVDRSWAVDITKDPSTGELYLSGSIEEVCFFDFPEDSLPLKVEIDHLKLPIEGLSE